jgi:peptidase M1-like protein
MMRRLAGGILVLAIATVPTAGVQGQQAGPQDARTPVTVPAAFRSAVAANTRSIDGRPGAAYWQQRVDYALRGTLTAEGRVEGRGTIRYQNNSPDTLTRILLHLEQNVFKEGARRNRRAPITGGIEVTDIRVGGVPANADHPGSRYYKALTLLEVQLPTPLLPGGSAEISSSWTYTIPPAPTFRNGNLNDEVFAIAQWYPRVAVYDDVYGWDETPYLGDGEFYLEYGDFDVELTVPEGWLVGATGTLQNATEVIGEEAAARLAAAANSTEIVRIAEGHSGANSGADSAPDTGGTSTWHFTASDVRDFAWSVSPRYVWDAVGAGDGKLGQALYRPENEGWAEVARYAAHTMTSLGGLLGPYRYPQLTITEGPVGGMEYPMMVFNPSASNPRGAAGVTIHEGGHQWFPMMVGSMEAKHAWMDEGFTSYWQVFVSAELWNEEVRAWGTNRSYLAVAGTEREVPLMTHTDLVNPYGARTLAAYRKPAVVLGALRETIGDDAFMAAFRDYFQSWTFKHPQPWDFFNTVERHVGADLDWFWGPLFFGTEVLDHAVGAVDSRGDTTTIEIQDLGGVILPARVVIEMEGGAKVERVISAERWMAEGRVVTLEVSGHVSRVVIDPELAMPDVDRTNNRWER